MSRQGGSIPGFHAIMMAAAFAEEGLADAALELLRDGADERLGEPSAASATPVRRWAGLDIGARKNPSSTA